MRRNESQGGAAFQAADPLSSGSGRLESRLQARLPAPQDVAYVLETQKCFEDLRQVAAQLAGLLVLEAAGAQSGIPEHPMLAMAEQMYGDAIDGIQCARVTERARRHHECLLQAADAIRSALDAAHRSLAIDPILTPLRIAYARLQTAASELPGFEMVSFQQGCCGVPVRSAR